jgi:hypothetical protein
VPVADEAFTTSICTHEYPAVLALVRSETAHDSVPGESRRHFVNAAVNIGMFSPRGTVAFCCAIFRIPKKRGIGANATLYYVAAILYVPVNVTLLCGSRNP